MAPGHELPDWLRRRALLSGERLAVAAGGRRQTFAELDAAVSRRARQLAGLGVGPGGRVAVLLGNGLAFAELVFAVARLGAVLVPLNTRLAPAELLWQMGDAEPCAFVYGAETVAAARPVAREYPALPRAQAGAAAEGEGLPDPVLAQLPEAEAPLRSVFPLDEVHTIVYTSGTTGRPKGAQLTYGNHWWSAVGSSLHLGHSPSDRWLACLPLFHVGGLAILFRAVLSGCGVVVHPGFDPDAVNVALDEEGITLVSLVPTMLARVLAARGSRPFPATLRCILLGGGPAPAPLLAEAARRKVPVATTYGLTEAASQVTTLPPGEAGVRPGSSGKPLFPTEVQIAQDGALLGPGEVGEILVRGPTVTPGYFRRPAETARARQGGWLHTGDLGYLDEQGYLYVVDRRDDLIVSGGENVYPAEVEAVLLAHPAVAEAGVTGVPDETWGRAVAAVVRLKDGMAADPQELLAFCRRHLAGYKVPRHLQITTAPLPRNAGGKLLRRALWREPPPA